MKAIFMTQFVFGEEYNRNKCLNRCYHNIGSILSKTWKSQREQDAFEKAVEFEYQFNSFKETLPNKDRRISTYC